MNGGDDNHRPYLNIVYLKDVIVQRHHALEVLKRFHERYRHLELEFRETAVKSRQDRCNELRFREPRVLNGGLSVASSRHHAGQLTSEIEFRSAFRNTSRLEDKYVSSSV